MKKAFGLAALLAPLCWQMPALAHAGGKHVMGTVKAVDDQSLTVSTRDRKEVKVKFDAETRFEKSGKPASPKDLSVGERVVVHTRSAKDGAPAALIKFGAQKTAGAPKQGHQH
jgi:uncharacterized protein DUF5666